MSTFENNSILVKLNEVIYSFLISIYSFVFKPFKLKLTQDKWCIISCNERSIDTLNDNKFCFILVKDMPALNHRGDFHALLIKPPNGLMVDQINRKSFDNRIENLRTVTSEQNMQNKTKYKNNISGIMGIRKRQNSWVAQIRDNNNKAYSKYQKHSP